MVTCLQGKNTFAGSLSNSFMRATIRELTFNPILLPLTAIKRASATRGPQSRPTPLHSGGVPSCAKGVALTCLITYNMCSIILEVSDRRYHHSTDSW